jgi:hypothetical protein
MCIKNKIHLHVLKNPDAGTKNYFFDSLNLFQLPQPDKKFILHSNPQTRAPLDIFALRYCAGVKNARGLLSRAPALKKCPIFFISKIEKFLRFSRTPYPLWF